MNLGEKEGSVFFFNDSSSENITLSIAWDNRAAHCASENLKLKQDGSLHTIRPMKRKDFSIVCFPESGEYNYNELMPPSSNLLIDRVGLVSATPRETPTRFVRTIVQNGIRNTQLQMVDPTLIEIALPHHGFGNGNGTFDIAKLRNTTAAEICTHLTQCDAVLHGTIHRWERNYYGIQSVNVVDIELELRSARDNNVLYQVRLKDTDSRGIAGGPTGISDLFLEPIRGLDSEVIEDLARSVITRLLEPLNPQKVTKNGGVPSIYAATHNARLPLEPHSEFDVLLFGSPNALASFRIGNSSGDIPLIERSPGHYSGKYFGQPYDHFKDQPLFVTVRGRSGLITEQEIAGPSFLKR